MTEQFLSEAEIDACIETCSTSSLRNALENAIHEYLRGDYGEGFNEEKFRVRRHAWYQGYHPYIIYA